MVHPAESNRYHQREAARLRTLLSAATTAVAKTRLCTQIEDHERLAALDGQDNSATPTQSASLLLAGASRRSLTRSAQIASHVSEIRFRVRVRIAVSASSLGDRRNQMQVWLDRHCGLNGWTMALTGGGGIINDAVAVYLIDAAIASAFVARWCEGQEAEIDEGVFVMRKGLDR